MSWVLFAKSCHSAVELLKNLYARPWNSLSPTVIASTWVLAEKGPVSAFAPITYRPGGTLAPRQDPVVFEKRLLYLRSYMSELYTLDRAPSLMRDMNYASAATHLAVDAILTPSGLTNAVL